MLDQQPNLVRYVKSHKYLQLMMIFQSIRNVNKCSTALLLGVDKFYRLTVTLCTQKVGELYGKIHATHKIDECCFSLWESDPTWSQVPIVTRGYH